MERARKEKWLAIAGLGIALAGGVWFGLAAASNLLQGMVKVFGFPLGPALVVSGLVMSWVYLFRWRRIKNLTSGKNLLAQWKDGESEVFIASDCGYIGGELYLWSGYGARLEQVTLAEKESYGSTAAYLEIQYARLGQGRDFLLGRRLVVRSDKISIRIPPDKMADARGAVEKLQEVRGGTFFGPRVYPAIAVVLVAAVLLWVGWRAYDIRQAQVNRARLNLQAQADQARINSSPGLIPATTANLKANLDKLAGDFVLDCKDGKYVGVKLTYRLWRCENRPGGSLAAVEIYSRDNAPEKADLIRASMAPADQDKARSFFTGVAALPLPGGDSQAAQDWVAKTLPALVKEGDGFETNIGGVRFSLYLHDLDILLMIGSEKF